MTNEELDRARGAEAYRLWESAESRVGEENRAMIAARLAREGWKPPEPVDPDVLAVREIVAREWEKVGFRGDATDARSGNSDSRWYVSFALAAYKAGKAAR